MGGRRRGGPCDPPGVSRTDESSRSNRWWRWEVAAACGGLLVSRLLAARLLPLYDDAFITLRQGVNLAEHGELAYHLGDPALVSTSPMFVFVAALLHLVGADPAVGIRVVGALAEAVGIGLLGYAVGGRRIGVTSLLALAAARSRLLSMAAVGGLETWPFVLLIVTACLLAARGRGRVAGLAAGVAAGLRPEGLVLLPVLLVVADRRPLRLGLIVGWAASMTVWLGAVVALGASPLPRSITAKWGLRGGELLAAAKELLAADPALLLALPFAVLALRRTWQSDDSAAGRSLAVWGVVCALGYLLVRPQIWEWYGVPFLLVLVAWGARGVRDLAGPWMAQWTSGHVVLVAVGLAFVAALPSAVFAHRLGRDGPARVTTGIHQPLEGWASTIEPGTVVAAWDVGALGYACMACEIVDLNRLAARPERLRAGEAESLSAADPDWVFANVTRHAMGVVAQAGFGPGLVPEHRLSPSGEGALDISGDQLPEEWRADYLLLRRERLLGP